MARLHVITDDEVVTDAKIGSTDGRKLVVHARRIVSIHIEGLEAAA